MSGPDPREVEPQGGRAEPEAYTFEATFFAGPLPPPAILREYDRAYPGAAQQIIQMALSQSAHRQHLEKVVVEGNDRRATRGLYMAWSLVTLVLIFGFVLVLLDRNVAGFGLLIGDACLALGSLVYGRYEQRKERERKAKLTIPTAPPRTPQLPFPD